MKDQLSANSTAMIPANTDVTTPPDQAPSALSWPTTGLALQTGVPWLDAAAQTLREDFGLSPAASLLAPLTALGAAAGSSVRVVTPEGLFAGPQTNLLWLDHPGSRLREALRLCFSKVSTQCDGIRVSHRFRSAEEMPTQNQRSSKPKSEAADKVSEDSSSVDALHRFIAQGRAAANQPQDPRAAMEDVARRNFIQRPHFITESHGLAHLLRPRELSGDGAVVSLDFDGMAGSRLRNAPRNQLVNLAALLMRTWSLQSRPPCAVSMLEESTSCLWLLERSDVELILGDPAILCSGIHRPFLLCEATEPHARNLAGGIFPELAENGFDTSVHDCWGYRFAGKYGTVLLDNNATTILMRHVSARCKELPRFGNAAEGVAACLPTLVHKVALLLHMARHQGVAKALERKIGEGTVRAANGISDAVIATHLDLCRKHAARNPACNEAACGSEVELIIARLRVRGPLSARALARTFHRLKVEDLKPMLTAAVESGIVQQNEGKYALSTVAERQAGN